MGHAVTMHDHAEVLFGKKSGVFQYDQKLAVNLKAAQGVVCSFLPLHSVFGSSCTYLCEAVFRNLREPHINISFLQAVSTKVTRLPGSLGTDVKGSWANGAMTVDVHPMIPKVCIANLAFICSVNVRVWTSLW